MSYSDSNYTILSCPFCGENISNNRNPKRLWVDDLKEDEDDFFQCQKCDKFFRVKLNIYTDYSYEIDKPTKAEIEEYGFTTNNNVDVIADVPGQLFMWEDLFLDKS
jgi:hypothetical protein